MRALRPFLPLAVCLTASAVLAVPAQALPTCGSAGQPVCVEAPPPGVELRLSAQENPLALAPLAPPVAGELLWPRVRGHEPYGFNAVSAGLDGTTLDDEALLHQEVGASMARIAVDWGAIQYFPNRDAGGAPWAYEHHVDAQYRAYVRRGIRPLLTVLKTPRRFTRHATSPRNSTVRGCGTSDACHTPPSPEQLGRLATFAADLARRYPLAAGVEVWNEPNLSNPFWGGDPVDPEHYAAMLRTVHDAVKAERPAMRVLGGSLAGFTESYVDESGSERMALRTFLARALLAGASERMDAVSYHPYFGPYPTWLATLGDQDAYLFRRMGAVDDAVLGAYADAGTPLADRVVATELGASTTDGFTEERQAAWLRLRFWLWDTDHAFATLPVDAAFLHKAVEEPNPPFGQLHKAGFGLVRVKDKRGRFATKQAFCAFRTEFGGFLDCPQSVRTR